MSTAVAVSLPASLEALRSLLAPFPAPPHTPGMPSGVDALDAALTSGGLPRGRVTEVVGTSGKLTLLRHMVDAAIARGEWVAYIDATRTLAPRDWAHLGDHEGFWIVRPPDAARATWCADVLLRSAAFSLVVLDSAPPVSRGVTVRLTGLARESNAALVVVAGGARDATRLGGAVRLRVNRRRERLRITIEKGGGQRADGRRGAPSEGRLQQVVEVSCANGGWVGGVARRLCSHSEVPDRRGAARAGDRGSTHRDRGRRAASPAHGGHSRGMLQHC